LTLVEPLTLSLALVQAGAAATDTVVTLATSPAGLQQWVDLLTSIASIVIALALIAIAIPVIPAAWNLRKTYKKVQETVDRVQNDINPILHHAHAVADNVNYVTSAIRMDVQQLQGTIASTQERLNRAAVLAEQRINQFNALLEVVQDEAEDLFIGTAATIRGVKVGTEALSRFRDEPDWDDELEAENTSAGPTIRVQRRRPPQGH
jgi:uncharacterized protein YoxC